MTTVPEVMSEEQRYYVTNASDMDCRKLTASVMKGQARDDVAENSKRDQHEAQKGTDRLDELRVKTRGAHRRAYKPGPIYTFGT